MGTTHLLLEGIVTRGITQGEIPKKVFGEIPPNTEICYEYDSKVTSMSEKWRNKHVEIKVDQYIHVKMRKSAIKGKVLEIYQYKAKKNESEEITPATIYLAKIQLPTNNFTLHLHPRTIAY